jgi:hypothetical protein
LALPLVLGRLADMVGIRPAYGVVGVLLVGIFLTMLVTGDVFGRRPLRNLGSARLPDAKA